jgi:hypothetical protein
MSVYTRNRVGKDGKRSEFYYVEVSLPDGRKLKRSVGKKGVVTKSVARRVEVELKNKIRLGQLNMLEATIPTLNEFIPKFISYSKDIKQNRAWDVAEESIMRFARFFGNKKLSEINSADVEDYKRLRTQEGRKPATINRELAFVRHLFNYAKRCDKFHSNNPVSLSGLLHVNNQKTRVLTPEEESLLISNAG